MIETKKCSKCEEIKSVSEFYKNARYCKKCSSEYSRAWRKANPERHREHTLRWQKDNPEKCREHCRKYYAENKEKCRAQARAGYVRNKETRRTYYKNNKEKLCSKQRDYYAKNKEKFTAYSRKWRAENPDKMRELRLKQYAISQDDYNALLVKQGGVCAVCGAKPFSEEAKNRRLSVDHNHISGKVRGLLCIRCNIGLGMLRENLGILRNLIEYIEVHMVSHDPV